MLVWGLAHRTFSSTQVDPASTRRIATPLVSRENALGEVIGTATAAAGAMPGHRSTPSLASSPGRCLDRR